MEKLHPKIVENFRNILNDLNNSGHTNICPDSGLSYVKDYDPHNDDFIFDCNTILPRAGCDSFYPCPCNVYSLSYLKKKVRELIRQQEALNDTK